MPQTEDGASAGWAWGGPSMAAGALSGRLACLYSHSPLPPPAPPASASSARERPALSPGGLQPCGVRRGLQVRGWPGAGATRDGRALWGSRWRHRCAPLHHAPAPPCRSSLQRWGLLGLAAPSSHRHRPHASSSSASPSLQEPSLSAFTAAALRARPPAPGPNAASSSAGIERPWTAQSTSGEGSTAVTPTFPARPASTGPAPPQPHPPGGTLRDASPLSRVRGARAAGKVETRPLSAKYRSFEDI
jgi:hypothetical protein